jgi:alpha-tubulin suppressor-like RCC1 family protein
VTAIAAGLRHTCALTNAGGVKCWGLNDHGQVGTPGYVHSKPADVAGLGRSVIAIAAGGFHSCALTRLGSVKCWGRNAEGQLGDGTQVNRQRPVGVVGFGPAQASLAVISRSVHVTPGRLARIVLRCGPAARCRGVLSLSAIARGSAHTRITVSLGSGRFSISTGKTALVKVKLPVAGYRLLLRLKRLAARARIDYGQLDGTTTMRTSSVTLIAP